MAFRIGVITIVAWAAAAGWLSRPAQAQPVVYGRATPVAGGATCFAPATSCGETGGCVDLQSDVYNCGQCGNACADGLACSAGACHANWDIGFAFEAAVYLGMGGIAGPTRDTFAVGLWPIDEPFGIGVNTGFDVGIRFGNIGLGFRYQLQQYGAEADDYRADVLFLEKRYLGYLRFPFGNWFAGSMHADLFGEFDLGLGSLGLDFDGQRALTIDQVVAGARIGFGLAIVGRLQLGAYVGLSLQAPVSIENSAGGTIDTDIIEGSWQLGLMLRYTLPVSLRAAAAPPAPAPVFVTPPPPQIPPPPPAYLLVVTSSEAATREAATPKVTETPAYVQGRAAIHRVALAAPRGCGEEPAFGVIGQVQGSTATPSARCAADMTELERALTQRGYAVLSWRTIAQSADRAPLEVARQAGAEVLLQVNSIERTQTAAATDADLARTYFESDAYGQRGAPLAPSETVAAQLRELAQVREVSFAVQIVPGVTLDAQAIDVQTGQTTWLYQWRMVARGPAATSTETLAVGRVPPEYLEQLRFQQPTLEMRQWSATAPAPMVGGVVGTAAGSGGDPASLAVQRIFGDFASRFQTGVGIGANGSMPSAH